MSRSIALARNAMATRFEMVLCGENEESLRAAGEEAFDEVERLEAQLSLYRPESELSHINRRAAFEPVRVEPRLFKLLQRAQTISEQTNGAFDITAGPLMRCWGFMTGSGAVPSEAEINAALSVTGFDLLELDENDLTIRFRKQGVMLDLGSIGKGYALDSAVEILRESGIENALLHGGTSSTAVLGEGPDGKGWLVAIAAPPRLEQALTHEQSEPPVAETLALLKLKEETLSVSAIWGKSFLAGDQRLGHIIDSRTGWPAAESVLSAVIAGRAADSDAYSTALLICPKMGPRFANRHLTCRYVNGQLKAATSGIEVCPEFQFITDERTVDRT